jgi:surfactin synthase thioesterase subunit
MGAGKSRGWVRSLHGGETLTARVVCFPHSGGSAGTFRAWGAMLPPGVALAAVQYPGREDRLGDAPVPDLLARSAAVAAELLALDAVPTVLAGHSLGAIIGYEVASLLQAVSRTPVHLLVSGSPAPSRAGGGHTHLADDETLWSAVCRLGGVAPQVRDDPEMREVLLPALRSDITAGETYRPRAHDRLSCPVTCYHGRQDPLVREADLGDWALTTTGAFALHTRPGGHFAPAVGAALVAGLVAATTAESTADGAAGLADTAG